MTHVCRDPFSRTSLERHTSIASVVPYPTCTWCGRPRKRLYHYRTVADDASRAPLALKKHSWFCNLNCYRAHYA